MIKNKNIKYLFILLIILIILIIFLFKNSDNFKNSVDLKNNNIVLKTHKNVIKLDNKNIDKNIKNIFLFWEGSINKDRLSMLMTVIKSIYYFNNDP